MKRISNHSIWLFPLLTGLLFIGLWLGAIFAFSLEPYILPTPSAVLRKLIDARGELFSAMLSTGLAATIGFLAAAFLGYIIALLLSLSLFLKQAFYPWVVAFQMVPVVVLIPLYILWFDPGLTPIVLITFTISFFPVVANSVMGLSSVERNLIDLFRTFNASRWQEILYLRLPHSLPYFLTGLKIAATLAPIGAITGGMLAGTAGGFQGLGYLVQYYRSSIDAAGVLAVALLSCLLGFLFVSMVNWLSWLLLHKWHASKLRAE